MNNKDIKNRIKESAVKDMPDILHKIDLKSINIEPEQVKAKIGLPFNLKLAFSAFLLLITGFLAFQILNISDSTYPLDSDAEVLGFETVSAQALLEYSSIEETNLSQPLMMNSPTSADDAEAYLDNMAPMIELAELMVNNKDHITYEELDSDLEGYEKKIHFSAYNLNDQQIEYDIYYNHYNAHISGKIVNGNSEYEFTKTNGNLRLYENDSDFVEVMNMHTEDTHEFTYRYVRNQVEQFSTHIKMAVQNNNYQAEFNYQDNKGIKISLMMRRENQNTMDVSYDIEDQAKRMNGRFNVDVQNNQDTGQMMYRFIFDDLSTANEEKPSKPQDNNPNNPPTQDPPSQDPPTQDPPGNSPFSNPPGQN